MQRVYRPRTMKIHEYQARKQLADHGIPVPQTEVVFKRQEEGEAFMKLTRMRPSVSDSTWLGTLQETSS